MSFAMLRRGSASMTSSMASVVFAEQNVRLLQYRESAPVHEMYGWLQG